MKKLLFGIYALFMLATCTKEQIGSRPYPRVRTNPIGAITSEGVGFNGEIIFLPSPVTDHGFVWSADREPTFENADSVSLGSLSAKGAFSYKATRNLFSGKTYYVRAFAKSENFLVYGETISFISAGSTTPFEIVTVTPTQHLLPGATITVTGKNFGVDLQVKFAGRILNATNVSGVTATQFSFKLPDSIPKLSSFSVIRYNQEITAKQQLSAVFSLKNKGRPLDQLIYSSTNCVAGGKDIFGFGYSSTTFNGITNSMFSFDPVTNVLSQISQQTISPRYGPISFSINGITYFGGGKTMSAGYDPDSYSLADFYSFDPQTNQINRLGDLPLPAPGSGSDHAVAAFVINGKAYCLTFLWSPSPKNEFYEFDPSTGQWTKKADFPGATRRLGFYNTFTPFVFALDGIGYLGGGAGQSDLWGYDPVADTWAPLSFNIDLSGYGFYSAVSASGTVYLVDSRYLYYSESWVTSFYPFDPAGKTFGSATYSTTVGFNLNGAFSAGNSGYLFSGSSIWEFDPSM